MGAEPEIDPTETLVETGAADEDKDKDEFGAKDGGARVGGGTRGSGTWGMGGGGTGGNGT